MTITFYSNDLNRDCEVEAIDLRRNKFMIRVDGRVTILDGADRLLQAHDDAIRRECADRAVRYIHKNMTDFDGSSYYRPEFEAAILGKEAEK